jgi:hypothetical protein
LSQEGVVVKRLVVLTALAVVLTGLLISGLPDNASWIASTDVPGDDVATSVGEAEKSDSTSARITIMMYALPLEGEDNR